MEPPAGVVLGYMMPSHCHPLAHPRNGNVRRGQLQEVPLDAIPLFPPLGNHSRVAAAAQSCLECEIISPRYTGVDHLQHHPPSLERRPLRLKRVQTCRYQVGVDQRETIRLAGQVFCGERGLARAVGPGDDHDSLARVFGHRTEGDLRLPRPFAVLRPQRHRNPAGQSVQPPCPGPALAAAQRYRGCRS